MPHQIEVELGDEDPVLSRRAAPLGDGGREKAHPTERQVAAHEGGRLPLDQERRAGRFDSRLDADQPAEALGCAFDVEKIHLAGATRPVLGLCRSRPRDRHAARFPGSCCEPRPDLEEADVPRAVAAIVRHRIDEPRQQRGSHGVERRRQGIGHADERWPLALGHEAAGRVGFDKAERDGLRQSGRGQHASDELVARNPFVRLGRRQRHRRKRGFQLVEPVMAADLFDEIDLAQQVHAKRWRNNGPAVGRQRDRQAQPAENARDVGVGHLQAEEP